MISDSPIPSAKDNLVFGGGHHCADEDDDDDNSKAEHDEEDYELANTADSDNQVQNDKPASLYYKLFKEMLCIVLQYESHLFTHEEIDCLERFSNMSYNAKYLLIRLSLRKIDKWHRLDALKYQSEMGNGSAIKDAICELCGVAPAMEEDVKAEVKEEEPEVIDLTMDEDTEDVQHGQPDLGLSAFCEDDARMTMRELLGCLTTDEIKGILRQLKLKTVGNRASLISALEYSANTQCTLSFLVAGSSKGKEKAVDVKPLVQTCLPFAVKSKMKTQAERLREMVMQLLGKCIRINVEIFKLFQRINLVFFRNTQHSPTLLTPSLLSRTKKRFYPGYTWSRTRTIWNTRSELLGYEAALELEARVDGIVGGMGAGTGAAAGRSVASKTPVRRFATPSTPGVNAPPTPTPGKGKGGAVAMDKENASLVGGGAEEKEVEAESQRVVDARAVKAIFESVYERWRGLVQTKGEEAARCKGLERFDCGHVLTRIVCKGTYALGVLKEHKYEAEVLSALLAQRRWRQARRGRWHDRLALILMTHFPKNEETMLNALNVVVEALKDDDTHIIYRPMLERRLTRLEKKLKLPADERHVSEGKLRKSEAVFIEGVRVRNRAASLVLDRSGRAVGSSGTPVKSEEMSRVLGTTPRVAKGAVSSTPLKGDKAEFVQAVLEKSKGKSVWRGKDGEEVNVETFALQYYEGKGFKGFHCEGRIVCTLFGLLFWDILFADIPGAFETPYQSAPLDIAEETFYHARKERIETRLREIEEGKAASLLDCVDRTHRKDKKWCIGVRWDLFEKESLVEIADCLGGQPLSVICRLLCEDYAGRGSGVPDLCIWNAKERKCMFVEVKGPGDTLQENQKIWIDVLLRAGALVEICHVAEHGQSKAKKTRKAKTKKTGAKSKKRASEVDSDSEPEPVLESEDEQGEVESPEKGGRGVKRKAHLSEQLPVLTDGPPGAPLSRASTSTVVNRGEVVIESSPRKKAKWVAS